MGHRPTTRDPLDARDTRDRWNLNDEIRDSVIQDIFQDRLRWRLTELPQIVTLFLLAAALLVASGTSLYSASGALDRDLVEADLLRAAYAVVAGSSSLLGFFMLRLLARLSETTQRYFLQERRFTSDINMVRLATTREEVRSILRQYQESL